jgi:hypothetical protein
MKTLCFLLTAVVFMPGNLFAAAAVEEGKNWRAHVDLNYVYDDNLAAAPKNETLRAGIGRVDNSGFQWSGGASYDLKFSNKYKLNFSYDANQVVYNSMSQFDMLMHMFGGGFTYNITPLFNFTLDYKYIYSLVNNDKFSEIHYYSPAFNYFHEKFGLFRPDFTYKRVNNFQFDTLDMDQYSVGFAHYYFFSNFTRNINYGYHYGIDQSFGDAFQQKYHIANVGGSTPLWWGFDLTGRAVYSFRDYDKFVARFDALGNDVLRQDTMSNYNANISKVLINKFYFVNNVKLNFDYLHSYNNSNLVIRDYVDNRYTVGVSMGF